MAAKELPKGDDTDQTPKKRSRVKTIVLLGSILLVLAASGGGGYWWLFMRADAPGMSFFFSDDEESQTSEQSGGNSEEGSSSQEGDSSGDGDESSSDGVSTAGRPLIKPMPLPSITVNLADSQGNRYLRVGMEVEVNDQAAINELKAQSARVRDAIILLLSSKSVADLASPAGKVLLKNEVVSRLNQILGASRVVRIYFTDFVIQ